MSAKRIFPPLCMVLFSCNDPCFSASIWKPLVVMAFGSQAGQYTCRRLFGWWQQGFCLFLIDILSSKMVFTDDWGDLC